MADLLLKISSLQASLPTTQQAVAGYILQHADDIPFLSIHELARAAKVSVATVSRFARAMGYRGLKDFKAQLGRTKRPVIDSIYEPIGQADDDQAIIAKVFAGNQRSLEDTLQIVDRGELIAAGRALARARRVLFFGIGSSGYLAQDAALRFAQLGIPAEAYFDAYQVLVHVTYLQKGEAAVGISHTGHSAITVQALELAQRQGVLTVGIANYLHSPLHRVSRHFLCTSFPENRVSVAALASRVAQMCLLDALYLLVARHRRVRPERLEELNQRAVSLVRMK
jgi:RpiR family transcriptional regulator, carbohydrate utilization regulator